MIQTLSPLSAAGLILSYLRTMGGKGSGNYGHAGRPGERGGSAPTNPGERESAAGTKQAERVMRDRLKEIEYSPTFKKQWFALATERQNEEMGHAVADQITEKLRDKAETDPKLAAAIKKLERGPDSLDQIVRGDVYEYQHRPTGPSPFQVVYQRAVKEEFGVSDAEMKHLKPYPEDRKIINEFTTGAYDTVFRANLHQQYDDTQEMFKKAGVKEVTLYRGMAAEDPKTGNTTIKQQPASPWSTDRAVAEFFSYGQREVGQTPLLVSAKVPVSRILSTAATGFGAFMQSEMLVLGGDMRVHVRDVTNDRSEARRKAEQTLKRMGEKERILAAREDMELDEDWILKVQELLKQAPLETLGGPGSGNFDHKGRPGEVGGSSQSATARKKSERQQAIVKKLTSKYGFPEHKIIIKDMSNEKFTVNGREYETGGRYSHDTGEITVDSKTYSNRDFAGIVAHEITHDAFRQVDRSSNDTPEVKRFHDFLMNNRHELMDQDGVTKYSTAYWGKVAGPEGSENYKRALNETLAEVSFLKEAFHGGDTPPAWSVKPVWTDLHTRLFDAYRAINSGIAEKSPIFQKVKGR